MAVYPHLLCIPLSTAEYTQGRVPVIKYPKHSRPGAHHSTTCHGFVTEQKLTHPSLPFRVFPTQAPPASPPNVWRQIPLPLIEMASSTLAHLRVRYADVLDGDNDGNESDEEPARLQEGNSMLETYSNMLAMVMAGVQALTFDPPGIDADARASGLCLGDEAQGAAARAWAEEWLVKPASRGDSTQRECSQPQDPQPKCSQPQDPHHTIQRAQAQQAGDEHASHGQPSAEVDGSGMPLGAPPGSERCGPHQLCRTLVGTLARKVDNAHTHFRQVRSG